MLKYKKYDNNDLLESYSIYYSIPNNTNLRRLFNSIIAYNFDNYNSFLLEMSKITPHTKYSSIKLQSNSGTYYHIGPNGHELLNLVEDFLRYKHAFSESKKIVFVHDRVNQPERYKNEHSYFAFNVSKELEEIKEFCNGKIVIGYAHTLNQIQTASNYLVNIDVPCFVNRKGSFVNDQMINWKSGLNFWTCTDNHLHFLPIFNYSKTHYTNLLNFNQIQQPIDDHFKIKSDFFKCSCGRYRCEFDFIPHVANFPTGNYRDFLDLVNHIEDTRWIQFIFDKGLFVYYTPLEEELSTHSIKLIENTFNEHVTIIKNKAYPIGQKLPAFWKLTS